MCGVLRIGLTGGTGAGKSTVARLLAGHGAVVVDADALAREVLAPASDGLAAVAAEFGPGVLAPDGALDRAALAAAAFSRDERRRALEAITHPRIAARTRELFAAAAPDALVVHDVPLLVEKGMGPAYHLVVVIDAPVQVRVRRLSETRGMSDQDARARIRVQASPAQRRAAADVWIGTDRPKEEVAADVDRLWHGRLLPFERNVRTRTGCRSSVKGPARLVLHDLAWAADAARLTARVAVAAGAAGRGVEHIGSTAVPGLAAKPVLDLQLAVDTLADDRARGQLVDRLCAAGFPGDGSWQQDVPKAPDLAPTAWRKLYHRSADPGSLPVHLHVREHGSPGWRWALLTRDWWRADDAARQRYQELKWSLAARYAGDTSSLRYAEAKEPWFAAASGPAEEWADRIGWAPR